MVHQTPFETDRSGDPPESPPQFERSPVFWILPQSSSTVDTDAAEDPAIPTPIDQDDRNNSNVSSVSRNNTSTQIKALGEAPSRFLQNNDEDDEEDDEENNNREMAPQITQSPGKKELQRPFGKFTGVANVVVADSIVQTLTISFCLQILPVFFAGEVDCQTLVDNLIITASRMEDTTGSSDNPVVPDHYFIVEEAWVTVGPSGNGHCSQPHSPHPRLRFFYDRISNSSNWETEFRIQGSVLPKGTAKLSYGRSNQCDSSSLAAEVRPVFIGQGQRKDFEWRYKPASVSSKTHIEFSTTSPPNHTIKYTMDRNNPVDALPNYLRVRVRVIFRAPRRVRRISSKFPAKLRFFRDREIRHISMTIEADIGLDGVDYYEFPTATKSGCEMAIDVDASQGLLGQCGKAAGVVQSKLNSYKERAT